MEYGFDNTFAKFRLSTDLHANFLNRKERLTTFTIIWVVDGMAKLSVDGILLSLKTHQMAFITPLKEVELMKSHGDLLLLQFNKAFYHIRENYHEISSEGILYFGAKGIPIIDLNSSLQIQSFVRLVEMLEEEFEISDTLQEEMLRVLLKNWLIKSTRIIKKQQTFIGSFKPKTELVRQFHLFLEENYRKLHKVSDYAQLLNKSPKTISNQFKILGLESPSKFIQQRILLEAKRYLMYSDLSIKEMASHLGFEDAGAFSNYFKNRTSLTPSQFSRIYFQNKKKTNLSK